MKTNEALRLLDDKDFLDKIYHFSYRRCSSSYEAEELCSDIIYAVITAIHKQESIENFQAFVWTVAHRVYADHCEKRNAVRKIISIENEELNLASKDNEIEDFIEKEAEKEQIAKIFGAIAFLSKIYREVTVMYYIDELCIKDIAVRVGISETAVKQRLFSARETIRKEVVKMNEKSIVLKPVRLAFFGTGNPDGNDPRSKAERVFSQNLIYLCKEKPRTAKELSELLCVPMPFIEEELEIQCRGKNGSYGYLRKLENGKYTINTLIVDYDEFNSANAIYEKHFPEICAKLKESIEEQRENILSFPFLSEQRDIGFIMWTLISRFIWRFEGSVNRVIKEKHFKDIEPAKRDFTSVGYAFTDEQNPDFSFYGCDGICASYVGNYKYVFISNIYGKLIYKHFSCGHNIANDGKLLMLLKAIGGIDANGLSEDEREVAAKAIECGYLRKNGDILEPKIVAFRQSDSDRFEEIAVKLNEKTGDIAESIAEELADFMKAHIPEHLMNDYQYYTSLVAGVKVLSQLIDEAIEEGILTKPENPLGAEGMILKVEK